MSQKIFYNDLVAIHKSKFTLTLNKPAYEDLIKALMYDFHYDFIENKYGNNSRLLFTVLITWSMKSKKDMFIKFLVKIKKCVILVIIQVKLLG